MRASGQSLYRAGWPDQRPAGCDWKKGVWLFVVAMLAGGPAPPGIVLFSVPLRCRLVDRHAHWLARAVSLWGTQPRTVVNTAQGLGRRVP